MGNANAPATDAESTTKTESTVPNNAENGKLIAGRYRLEEKILGSGAFAVVKLGTDVTENKHVAIRIIDKEKLTPVSMQYLRREMEIYPKLSHPNVVQCYYSKEGKKFVVMVTEYMPDGNLSTHLTKRAMVREPEAREIFDQVLSAVEYLYSVNVAWRDLKCSNILLNLDKNLVKICDFGFAEYADKPFTDFPGTMAYSPPEVVSATPYVGASREVWSFGVLLYKLLAGTYPFGTKTNVATKECIIKAEPDFDLLYVSDEGLDLLKQMLAKDPAKRIGLYDIRKHPWLSKDQIVSRRRAQSRSDATPPVLARRSSMSSSPLAISKTATPSISPRSALTSSAGSVPQISPRGPQHGSAAATTSPAASSTSVGSPPVGSSHLHKPMAHLSASPQRPKTKSRSNSVVQDASLAPRKTEAAEPPRTPGSP